jgi:hypothetical protein
MSWTECPECHVGKGQDHLKTCPLRLPPPITIHGVGTPLDCIVPGNPDDGSPDALIWRRLATDAMAIFEDDNDVAGRAV